MEINNEAKLELTRNGKQDLMLYFFVAKKINDERVVAILAYQLEDALQRAKQEAVGFTLFYNGQKTSMRELLLRLQTGGVIFPASDLQEIRQEQSLPAEKISFENFKSCLLMALDDYVIIEDKDKLKEIIGRLKYPSDYGRK